MPVLQKTKPSRPKARYGQTHAPAPISPRNLCRRCTANFLLRRAVSTVAAFCTRIGFRQLFRIRGRRNRSLFRHLRGSGRAAGEGLVQAVFAGSRCGFCRAAARYLVAARSLFGTGTGAVCGRAPIALVAAVRAGTAVGLYCGHGNAGVAHRRAVAATGA